MTTQPHSPPAGHRMPEGIRNVLVLGDHIAATQRISFEQPLAQLAGGALRLEMHSDRNAWRSKVARNSLWQATRPDLLVLSRYTHPRSLPWMELAHANGIPFIYHIDDDLLDVPLSLGQLKYDYYHQPERLDALRRTLDGADLVYASTPALADRLRSHGITSDIAAGEVYCSVDLDTAAETHPATGPVFGYMGTGGHSDDLAMVLPAVVQLMRDMPTLRFETFGTITPPDELAEFGQRYAHHPGDTNYANFLRKLGRLGWWVGIAPLEDNAFNRCKADTKWVEYSMAGMAVVATDLPVYHHACENGTGVLAACTADWYHGIATLLKNADHRQAMVARARAKLTTAYSHHALCEQVVSMFARAQTNFNSNATAREAPTP